MGTNYVLQQPYNMAETYVETSPATPMFFVLFPGVDPTPWVESLARTLDITTENGACTPHLRISVEFSSLLSSSTYSRPYCCPRLVYLTDISCLTI